MNFKCDFLSLLKDSAPYRATCAYLAERKTIREMQRAPVEKSFSLAWCLQNEDLLVEYYLKNIQAESYSPQIRRKSTIAADKERVIYSINWVDKIFDHTLAHLFFEKSEGAFSEALYSYRPGHSNIAALKKLGTFFKERAGQELYIVQSDIKAYTDSLSVPIFLKLFEQLFGQQDPYFLKVLEEFLSPKYYDPETDRIEDLLLGVPTGSHISNFVANLYLNDLDHLLKREAAVAIRYGDDLLFACQSEKEARRIEEAATSLIEERELTLHPDKIERIQFGGTHARPPFRQKQSLNYLGFELSSSGGIFLRSDKLRKLKREVKQYLLRARKQHLKHSPEKDLVDTLIREVNSLIKDFSLIQYLDDLIVICDNEEKLKAFDLWTAQTLLVIAFGGKKQSIFKHLSYKELRDRGLNSTLHAHRIRLKNNAASKTSKN